MEKIITEKGFEEVDLDDDDNFFKWIKQLARAVITP